MKLCECIFFLFLATASAYSAPLNLRGLPAEQQTKCDRILAGKIDHEYQHEAFLADVFKHVEKDQQLEFIEHLLEHGYRPNRLKALGLLLSVDGHHEEVDALLHRYFYDNDPALSLAAAEAIGLCYRKDTEDRNWQLIQSNLLNESVPPQIRNALSRALERPVPNEAMVTLVERLASQSSLETPEVLASVGVAAWAAWNSREYHERAKVALEKIRKKLDEGVHSHTNPKSENRYARLQWSVPWAKEIPLIDGAPTRVPLYLLEESAKPTKLNLKAKEHGQSDFALDGMGVRNYRPEQLAARRLYAVNGRLYDAKGELVDTSNHLFNYVVDLEGHLYLGERNTGSYNHGSFFNNGPVAGAGEISIKNGKVVLINNNSGHYLPGADVLEQVVQRFKEIGVEIPADNIKYYKPREAIH